MRALLFVIGICLAACATADETAPTVVVVGDSISAAHGIAVEAGWVARLRARLAERGYTHEVVNASVSGDTTGAGRARLPDALGKHQPNVVVIQLGGNDGLRGLSPSAMRDNLAAMIERSRRAGARVLLLGLRLPPNYGRAYIERFLQAYRDVAEESGVAFVAQLLAGVGERKAMMQQDGIHPNARGHRRILDNIWPALEPLLQR